MQQNVKIAADLASFRHHWVLGNPNHRTLPIPSADERFRAAVRREMAKAGLA